MYKTKSNKGAQFHIAEIVDEKYVMHILVGGPFFWLEEHLPRV